MSAGDGRGPMHGDADRGQGATGVDQGDPGGHQVVHEQHHRPRPCPPQAGRADRVGLELARGDALPLRRGQPGGVRADAGGPQHREDAGGHARAAQEAARGGRQPLDVLTAAGPRDGRLGRHGHQPEPPRPGAEHLGDGGGQRRGQRGGEVPAAPLLVGEQAGTGGAGVGRGDGERREAGGGRVGSVAPRGGKRGGTAGADRSPRTGAPHAATRQGQVGENGEHGTTVAAGRGRGKAGGDICGQPRACG